MGADKTYEYAGDGKLNNHNKPVIITPYVKNVMLITDIIGCRKILPYFSEIMPLRLLGNIIPSLQRNFRVLSSGGLIKLPQLSV